jgi:hypothetical protein
MPHDPEAFAEMVVLTIKAALAPVLERLAVSEQSNRELAARVQDLTALRDRVTTVEAKAGGFWAMPPMSSADVELLMRNYVDPRLTSAEQIQGELRDDSRALTTTLATLTDRLVAVEAKAALPPHADPLAIPTSAIELAVRNHMQPVTQQIETLTAGIHGLDARATDVKAINDRVAALETKAVPEPRTAEIELAVRDRLDPVLLRLTASEQSLEARGQEIAGLRDRLAIVETKAAVIPELPPALNPAALELSMRDRIEPVTKQVATLSERIAVLEVRAPMPGPPGKDGADGKDGAPGIDGVGFDDLGVEFDGDRTLALKFVRGDTKKTFPIVLPFQRYQGLYQQGKAYDVGDTVTYGGHLWHCREETVTPPGDASKVWQMAVRKGRDGKDGRDAPQPTPVVSVK